MPNVIKFTILKYLKNGHWLGSQPASIIGKYYCTMLHFVDEKFKQSAFGYTTKEAALVVQVTLESFLFLLKPVLHFV